MTRLTIQDFRNALIGFAVIFALLAACILATTNDLGALAAPGTIAIIAAISAAAAIADLVIKHRRRQRGISDEMLIQKAQADVRAGRSPLQILGSPWVNISVAIVVSLVLVSARYYFGA